MFRIYIFILTPLIIMGCSDRTTPKKRKKKHSARQKMDDSSPKKLTFETDLWSSLGLLTQDGSVEKFNEIGKPLMNLTGDKFFGKLDELLHQSKEFRLAFFEENEKEDWLRAIESKITENTQNDIEFIKSRLLLKKLNGRIETNTPFQFNLVMVEGPLPDLGYLLHDSSVVFHETRNVEVMSSLVQGFNKNERAASLPRTKLRLIPGFGNEKVELAYAVDTDTLAISRGIRKYASGIGKYKGLKLAWSIHPVVLSVLQHQSGNTHALYGLRKLSSSSKLTNGYTDGAKLLKQGNDWVLNFEFIPEAADELGKILSKSSGKGPNPWAVVVNGRVLATPPLSAYSADGKVNIVLGSVNSPGLAVWANTWMRAFNQPLKNRYKTKVGE